LFETLFPRPFTARMQESAPFAETRSDYLAHLTKQGYARATVRAVARDILGVAERMEMTIPGKATIAAVESAVDRWMQTDERTSSGIRTRIVNAGRSWLRFSGMFVEKQHPQPFAKHLEQFTGYMREDRGLAAATISSRLKTIESFLSWFQNEKSSLSDAVLTDIDRYLACKGREVWKRRTVATVGQTLRTFFTYAEHQSWCSPGIAAGIDIPRIYGMENVPLGPSWEQVRALIATTDIVTRRNLRDRAALLLFSVYGLRCSEVRQLRLDDINWEREALTVRRAKSRKIQEFPLTREVGDAIIRYVREVRPKCEYREVFITLKGPWRPISAGQFYCGIRERMETLGIKLAHRGPHALRHACATHLMTEGLSLKEIGDHLGHSSPESTRIYAKVDILGLREVAEFGLGGL
jgi:integrase/recombinase XerD